MEVRSGARRRPGVVRIAAAGLALPAAASLAARSLDASTTTAALLYVLAVVGAAGSAGVWGGLLASALSFLGLNYLFTPPIHTFSVSKREDVVALAIFLVVSAFVGSLVSVSLSLRGRAERREEEARLVSDLTVRLRNRGPTAEVLRTVAHDLVRTVPAEAVRIRLEDGPAVSAGNEPGPTPNGAIDSIPIAIGDGEAGRLEIVGAPPGEHRAALLRTVAAQIGQALQGEQLDRAARDAAGEAEASQVRAALFGSVTHDLRTPLASIKAAVTSLMDEGVEFDATARRELLGTILEEADRLNRLVANLLELSRIRAGGLRPAKVPLAIGEVVDGVVGRLRSLLDGRTVEVRIRDDVPEIWADVLQIDQVLTNLLENAVRFSPASSSIRITAARWQDGVQVRVSDQGPGIAPEDRRRVFEAFYRGDEDGSRTGTGLGLAIADAVVTVHGGRIWAEGTPGGGATIVFELPAGRPEGVA